MTGFGNQPSGFPLICPVCREPLPAQGNRRIAIPSQGGRKRLVHEGCAEELLRQQTLDVKGAA